MTYNFRCSSNSLMDDTTHISDHNHEWRWHRRLVRAQISNQLLQDWFTKSIITPIARDVAMAVATTEEQAILQHA